MNDEPRDHWLREALRHAPDPQAPPASLREAILREARRPKAEAPAAPWWSRAIAWMVQPTVAAGFASVTVMTAAGLLWWDEPVPQMEREAPAAAVADAAAPPPPVVQAMPEPGAPRAQTPAPVLERADPIRRERKPTPQPAPSAAPEMARAAEAKRAGQEAESTARLTESDKKRADHRAMAPPPAPPVAPAVMAEAPAPKAAAAAPSRLDAPAGGLAGAAAAHDTVKSVRAAVAADLPRWTWQRQAGPPRPAGPALLAWLDLLDASSTAAWTPATGEPVVVGELRLQRGQEAVHRWAFSADGVTWYLGGSARFLPLSEPAVRRLLEALDGLP